MLKLSFPTAFVLAAAAPAVILGCSFQVGSKREPTTPQAEPAPAAPTPAQTAAPTPGKKPLALGKVRIPGGAPAGSATPAPSAAPAPGTPPAAPAGMPVLAGANIFGQGTPDISGWKGSFYVIPPATQKLPALAAMTPKGVLFAKELNVANQTMTGGFPGIDATLNENFAIRWEAPLVVENEADYTFRVVSDDGAIIMIDGTPIVDNDGQHAAAEKSGPVHLIKGSHVITVDYFQATGPVALQLFCKKTGGTETICPTRL